ncbi:hypothetical protein CL658_05150 [bacterium]|nr:hypothetical protein [bacterium]|tara:strand:+ start:373 stop:732 length:360 start_codon:yes stop_codon:yes gene_type:complete
MKNIFLITKESCNLSFLTETLPHTRWVHHQHCEEGIASISIFGKQLHAIFITSHISFLDPLQIHKVIKTQFLSLPVIIIRSYSDILDCIKGHYTDRCLASYHDFNSIRSILNGPISCIK